MTHANPAPKAIEPENPGSDSGRDFLIRSEEQLRIGTERVAAGLARLEKFVVTETKTITVQVDHEEVRLVHEPLSDETSAPASSGGQLNRARWMTISREEIVVTKKVVPVERVRLEVVDVVEQRQVTDSVRKETIDTTALPTALPSQP